MPGNRMDKLNQQFKREIGNMIVMGEISDPRLAFVSVTYADISKDLSFAHIGFSVLNDDPDTIRHAKEGLASASGRIRHILAERVEIRHMPEIKFVYDDTISSSMRMERKLEEIRQEREVEGAAEDGHKEQTE